MKTVKSGAGGENTEDIGKEWAGERQREMRKAGELAKERGWSDGTLQCWMRPREDLQTGVMCWPASRGRTSQHRVAKVTEELCWIRSGSVVTSREGLARMLWCSFCYRAVYVLSPMDFLFLKVIYFSLRCLFGEVEFIRYSCRCALIVTVRCCRSISISSSSRGSDRKWTGSETIRSMSSVCEF